MEEYNPRFQLFQLSLLSMPSWELPRHIGGIFLLRDEHFLDAGPIGYINVQAFLPAQQRLSFRVCGHWLVATVQCW